MTVGSPGDILKYATAVCLVFGLAATIVVNACYPPAPVMDT
jgi:hypothetical protein